MSLTVIKLQQIVPVPKHHSMKAYRGGSGKAVSIFNFDTGRR